MLPIDTTKPVKYEGTGRALKPELVATFFKHGFSSAERKYKVLFLVMATTGLRVGEVCAMNIKDFKEGTNFSKFNVKIQKRKKENFIATRVLPEATAAILRAWIRDNYSWILSKQGYIFPPPNNRNLHVRPANVQNFLAKKRKYLNKQFPDLGFSEVFKEVHYPEEYLNKWTGKKVSRQNLYKFSCHSFRHFYAVHIHQNPDVVRQLLRHEKLDTTLQYRLQADLLDKEQKLANELFDTNFYDAIANSFDNAVAIWDELKEVNP